MYIPIEIISSEIDEPSKLKADENSWALQEDKNLWNSEI